MTADIETAKTPIAAASHRPESRVRVRYRAPFALRCGALLIDYIVLALVLTFSIMIARLMGGGARLAGGTAEKIGIALAFIVAVADLGVLAGITGRSIGKWTTGLRIERIGGGPALSTGSGGLVCRRHRRPFSVRQSHGDRAFLYCH